MLKELKNMISGKSKVSKPKSASKAKTKTVHD